MKLWLISRKKNIDYYEVANIVVAAETEELARSTYHLWTPRDDLRCTYLGEARDKMPAGVVCHG